MVRSIKMIPTVIFGENRIEAKKSIALVVESLKTKGWSVQNVMADELETSIDLLTLVETPPLLGGKTAVIINYLSESPKKVVEEILQAIKNILPRTKTKIIFFEPYAKSIVTKSAKSWMWRLIEHKPMQKRGLNQAVAKKFKDAGVLTSYPNVAKFVARVGDNTNRIETEVQKIAEFTKQVDNKNWEEIEEIVPESKEAKIWALIDSIFTGDKAQAGIFLKTMLLPGEDPLGTSHLIYQQFRKLAKYISITEDRGNRPNKDSPKPGEIAARIGVPPFVIQRFERAKRKFSLKKCLNILNKCSELEQKIKSGQIGPYTGTVLLVNFAV